MAKRTAKKFLKAALAALDEAYDLIYVQQGDKLSDEQVAAVVEGDYEKLWDSTAEWESQARDQGIDSVVEEVTNQVVRDWLAEDEDGRDPVEVREEFMNSEHLESLREAIGERDRSTWLDELMNATPPVLLRILIDSLDEDHAWQNEDVDPAAALARVGLPVIPSRNRRLMAETLANASPEFSTLMGYWIVGADVRDLYEMPFSDTGEVLITNPHLYLGSPFAGSGFISEEAFEGVVRVKRANVKTDKAAFGHDVDSIYGGLTPSDFTATITALGERSVVDPKDPAPVIVAPFAGDGDIVLTVAYAGPNGRQVVLVDTEEHAQFQLIVNGKVVPIRE
jgi:hypothetical protein